LRSSIRVLLAGLLTVGLWGCADTGSLQPTGRRLALSVAPRFSDAARRASYALVSAGLDFDRLRIVVTRPVNDTLKDTTFTFHPTDVARQVELGLLAEPGEAIDVTIRFQLSTTVLFSGTVSTVAVPTVAAGTSAHPIDIVVSYVGPGATASRVALSHAAGIYRSDSVFQFSAQAFDASNALLPSTPITWSSSDTNVATVSATGLVTPRSTRGRTWVRAMAPNHVGDSVAIDFAPTATRLRVVQGAAQIALAGTQLPLPVIIEAVAADGLPASGMGLTGTFTTSNGGSVSPTNVTFGFNGRVQALVTLGPNIGGVNLYTLTSGPRSITFAEIAIVGPPAQLIPSGSTTFTMTAGVPPNPLPTLRVADAIGNSVTGVPLRITIRKDGNIVVSPFLVPSDTIGTLAVSAVAPTAPSTYSITVEGGPGVTVNTVVYTVTIVSAAPPPSPSLVILSEAKDLLLDARKQVLRFAQDDTELFSRSSSSSR
jgi:hypothetical protein